ncbi:MAG: DUF6754 domain-containing protein [Candidatus Zipacnadales bacterium]
MGTAKSLTQAPFAIQAEVPTIEEEPSGGTATITWQAPTAKPPAGKELKGYRVYQAVGGSDKFRGLLTPVTKPSVIPQKSGPPRLGTQVTELWTWRRYRFKVAALYGKPGEEPWYMRGQIPPEPAVGQPPLYEVEEVLSEDVSGWVQTRGRWYNTGRTNILIGLILYAIVVITFISRARAGREMYIRPIAGMEAIDEAIGRATEMGKPILYVAGLGGLGGISTITAMMILGRVARRTAEYETPLLVPCVDPLVMLAAREIVREAYLDAGKPEAYREQDIFFVTDRQFAYVAGVDGIMMREKPAANLYMGSFFAEALILAETGAVTGAIQIAGTDSDTQIPFFVTACDYTLMGEELYAATAYLSRAPMLLSQLKAQDIGKAFLGSITVLGTLAATVAAVLLAMGSQGVAGIIEKALDLLRPT